MADHAYSGIAINGDFDDTGEYFQVSTDLNGVKIRLFNLYVGDQREAFQEAHDNGQKQAQPAAE